MTTKSTSDALFLPVDVAEVEGLRKVLEQRGNKKTFLDSLPKVKVGKKMRSQYTRRQLDYGLERGVFPQGLIKKLRAFKEQVDPTPAPT